MRDVSRAVSKTQELGYIKAELAISIGASGPFDQF